MAIRVEQEGFACTWIKKDFFLNFAIIGQWNFDRLFPGNCYSNGMPIAGDVRMLHMKCKDGPNERFYVGKKPAEMSFERAYLA